jgi:group I intron endonuclease
MNFIYITTNLINGKQYVGSHNGNKDDNYLGSGILILKAIKKYGRENFERKIIESCGSKVNPILEEKYISLHNTLQPIGYNISPTGGTFKNGGKLSKETRQKISKAKKGSIPWNKGIKECFSKETTEKMSKSHKGKVLSDETKRKMSEFQKGRIKSEKEKRNIAESKKGKNNPMYGKTPWNKGKKIKN